jgi:C-terminal processing protease CtpA/Prc
MTPQPARLRRSAALLATGLFLCTPRLHAAQPAPTQPEPAKAVETVELPKMSVRGEAVCSYGIGVAAEREHGTKKIKRLFIYSVAEDSDAAQAGLKPGDEILSVNGHKVAGMDGTMKPGAELFDLLVDQPAGRSLALEVAVRTVRKVTLEATPDPSRGLRRP